MKWEELESVKDCYGAVISISSVVAFISYGSVVKGVLRKIKRRLRKSIYGDRELYEFEVELIHMRDGKLSSSIYKLKKLHQLIRI